MPTALPSCDNHHVSLTVSNAWGKIAPVGNHWFRGMFLWNIFSSGTLWTKKYFMEHRFFNWIKWGGGFLGDRALSTWLCPSLPSSTSWDFYINPRISIWLCRNGCWNRIYIFLLRHCQMVGLQNILCTLHRIKHRCAICTFGTVDK